MQIFLPLKHVFFLLTVSFKYRHLYDICEYIWCFTASIIICLQEWERIFIYLCLFINVTRIKNNEQCRKIKQLKFVSWQSKQRHKLFWEVGGVCTFFSIKRTFVEMQEILIPVPWQHKHKKYYSLKGLEKIYFLILHNFSEQICD